jgi:hypothetical protein
MRHKIRLTGSPATFLVTTALYSPSRLARNITTPEISHASEVGRFIRRFVRFYFTSAFIEFPLQKKRNERQVNP